MTIGEALKKERKDLGLTQTEMAAGVISTAHYSKIERDKHDISAYDLFEILTKNNISLLDFIKKQKIHIFIFNEKSSKNYEHKFQMDC